VKNNECGIYEAALCMSESPFAGSGFPMVLAGAAFGENFVQVEFRELERVFDHLRSGSHSDGFQARYARK